jgi:hypothetical protein
VRPLEQEHRADHGGGEHQRERLDAVRVPDRDHDDRERVVDDREGEQQRPEPGRDAVGREREDAQREGDLGREDDPPPVARLLRAGEEQEQERRHEHPADRRDRRERRRPRVAELSAHELALQLHPDQQEEDRHQPLVDPEPEVLAEGGVPEPDDEPRGPEPLVARAEVRPQQRDGDRDEQHDRARRRGR